MSKEKKRRKPCPADCPCICHDGFGGAHPNRDCRAAVASGDYAFGPNDTIELHFDEQR